MSQFDSHAMLGCAEVAFRPSGVSCEEFIRQEIAYYDRQAAKTREGLSEHLRRMHAFYIGLARHRRQQLARLSKDRTHGAKRARSPHFLTAI